MEFMHFTYFSVFHVIWELRDVVVVMATAKVRVNNALAKEKKKG